MNVFNFTWELDFTLTLSCFIISQTMISTLLFKTNHLVFCGTRINLQPVNNCRIRVSAQGQAVERTNIQGHAVLDRKFRVLIGLLRIHGMLCIFYMEEVFSLVVHSICCLKSLIIILYAIRLRRRYSDMSSYPAIITQRTGNEHNFGGDADNHYDKWSHVSHCFYIVINHCDA